MQSGGVGRGHRTACSGFGVRVGVRAGQAVVSFQTVPASGPGYEGLTRHYVLEQRAGFGDASEWQVVPGCEDILGSGQMVQHIAAGGELLVYRARV